MSKLLHKSFLVLLCAHSLACAVFWAGTSFAQGKTKAPVKAAPVEARNAGDLILEKSFVYIRVGKARIGHEHGVVGSLSEGTIHLNSPVAGDRLVFDMTTFDADTDAARKYVGLTGSIDESTKSQVNANMLGESVLNVAKYPTASFEVKSITPMKERTKQNLPQYKIQGDFTLHGTTRPVVIVSSAEDLGDETHLRGEFSVLQTDYGITPFTKAFGAVGVANKLQIWGDFWIANAK